MRQETIGLIVATLLLAGCGLTVPVKSPDPSGLSFAVANIAPIRIAVKDLRPSEEKSHSRTGARFSVTIKGLDAEMQFFATALAAELQSRGFDAVADPAASGPGALLLEIEHFYFHANRVSAFSPWTTFTNFRAKASYQGRRVTVPAYYHAGKVPKWSMSEIAEPTYNVPLRLVVRDVATKLNRAFFNATADPAALASATTGVQQKGDSESILALGFLGSYQSLPLLETTARTKLDTVEGSYALSSIGVIGDPRSLTFFKEFCPKTNVPTLLFCLKAAGDLGTPEALQWLRNQSPASISATNVGSLTELKELYSY